MRYRTLGRTGLLVSEIGLGALEMGRDWGIRIEGNYGRPPAEEAVRAIQSALERGITLIDTAPAYQLSEERVGQAVAGHRQEVVLATKVGEHYAEERGFWYDYSAQAVTNSIEQSLRRLQTEYLDLLQIHSASVEVIERGETLEAMQRFQRAGHVRFLGMTGGIDAALAAIVHGAYDSVQVDYNLLNQRAAHTVFPAAREHQIGVIVMSPLAQGSLTDKWEHLPAERQAAIRPWQFLVRPNQTLAQAALRFVLADETVSSTIPGSRTAAHIAQNVAAAEQTLAPEELERIAQVHDARSSLLAE